MKTVTLVLPVYNEGKGFVVQLKEILAQVDSVRDVEATVLIVDDGSEDDTAELANQLCDQREDLQLLCLNRHFGKEAAIQAALDHADTDAVIVMDSDLQHPPSLIPKMISLWLSGVDVVEAYKVSRGPEPMISRILKEGFYRLFRVLTGLEIRGQSDYKLLDSKVVHAYRGLTEHTRFFRGLVGWMGYRTIQVPFEVHPRVYGRSKWSLSRLVGLSVSAVTSFSSIPLHLITILGGLIFLISLALGSIVIFHKVTGRAVDGFTTVILLLLIIGSSLMFSIGLVGIYIARIYDEVKGRPSYIVNTRTSRLTNKRDG